MAKDKTQYTCSDCGGSSPKWLGKCPHCGAWNTLQEARAEGTSAHRFQSLSGTQPVATLSEIVVAEVPRTPTGQDELDRALGGGIVSGGVVLIGGDPGIGKSTLLLQAADSLSRGLKVLYITGEESGAQVALRARRLGLDGRQVRVLAEIALEKILFALQAEGPDFCVIDSIQTLCSEALTSAPGSVAQVRECAAQLTRHAKSTGTSIVLVGHVTKDGTLAGPRVLEHIVDTVLYFEGDTHSSFRLVRAIKNRFGAVNEIGVFAMTEKGLKGVANPSAIFLSMHDTPAWRCSTASSMASRSRSSPTESRRGLGPPESTSACTSTRSGRVPSSVTSTQLPGTGSPWVARKIALGFETPFSPRSVIAKTPISLTAPKRFLNARTRR